MQVPSEREGASSHARTASSGMELEQQPDNHLFIYNSRHEACSRYRISIGQCAREEAHFSLRDLSVWTISPLLEDPLHLA